MNTSLISKLIFLFIITQSLGLYVGSALISSIEVGDLEQPSIITDNPDDIENGVFLIGYILVMTGILLFVIKYVKTGFVFRFIETIAVFGAAFIVFAVFVGDAGLFLALAVIIAKNIWKKNIHIRNLASVLATAGVGALIGISLGLLPILVFIVLLSIYDIIAVFGTKHMVVMAKHLTKKNLAFTYAIPTKDHQFELGTGDLVIPLALSVSVLQNGINAGVQHPFVLPIAILIASLIGLILTLEYVSKKVGTAVPALPPQTLLMIIVFGIGKVVGF
jgi:presenilin-like A22 family membrane protease